MDAFATLGLSCRLVLADEDLANAWREAGKSAHPDAGGSPEQFAVLREARAVLASPSRRLRHWLELNGQPVDVRGTIDATLMEVFSEVGALTQQADLLIRKRESAASALVRAMLENESQQCRERIEELIATVERLIAGECTDFEEWQGGGELDLVQCGTTARNLAFLEKWRATLRVCFSRLV